MSDWPFEDPPNVAVFTTKAVVRRGEWESYVRHDEEDGAWIFLSNAGFSERDASLVGLGEMLRRDASLSLLADLPYGWQAERVARDAPWIRSEADREAEEA